MHRIVKKFGETVGKNITTQPQKALSLLNVGYTVSGLVVKYFPDQRLLPHQKYAAAVCNHTIHKPLKDPGNSAVVNLFFPCGLLQAMGITPQFVEGLSGFLNGAYTERAFIDFAENYGIPKTYCSYHKTVLGAALSGVLPKSKFIVNTTLVCDANTLHFGHLRIIGRYPTLQLTCPPNTVTKLSNTLLISFEK